MKPDISGKEDIKLIVDNFYEIVKTDKLVGVFFTGAVPIEWEQHIPIVCSFWENVLFHTGEYEGNPLESHRNLSRKFKTTSEHFKRWLLLFEKTIDKNFEGPLAKKMKQHAKAIAAVMQQQI